MLIASAAVASTQAAGTADQVSTILNAVAPLLWPVVVIVAILVFQNPLRAAIGRVSEVDVGTAKVVLQRQADTAANTAKAVATAARGLPESLPEEMSQAAAKATDDPSGSVLLAWRGLEDVIRTAQPQAAAQGVISPSVPEVVNAMTSGAGLDSSLVPVAKMLESVRSTAAASPEAISPATATSFVSAAGDLARLIAKAT
jgi:hypothetical protein